MRKLFSLILLGLLCSVGNVWAYPTTIWESDMQESITGVTQTKGRGSDTWAENTGLSWASSSTYPKRFNAGGSSSALTFEFNESKSVNANTVIRVYWGATSNRTFSLFINNGESAVATQSSSPNSVVKTLEYEFTGDLSLSSFKIAVNGGSTYFFRVEIVDLGPKPTIGSTTISYALTANANEVAGSTDNRMGTISNFSTSFAVSTLSVASGNAKPGYSGQITGHAADYSASQYVALSFNVASGYVFTPSNIGVTIFANSTSNMKAKVELTDGVTSVSSNELSCASSADSDIEFADGAFTGKKFKGTVIVKVYQWGVASKRAYIKSPVEISGSVAAELPNTVSFVAGDHGTYTGGDIAQASIGASITLPALTTLETGYNFNGWFTASSEGDLVGAAGASYTPAADITLYAQYSAKSYSITLDDNGGTKDGSATATYNSNKLTSITDPTWAGKAVVGYYKEAGLSNLIADAEGNLQKNTDYTDASGNWNHDAAVTLYAEWSTSHTVTAASNNNTYGTAEAAETSVAEGETTTITASANDGYKFRSWEVTGEGSTLSSTTANPTTLTMGTADATVTATFSALEHYTITYNKGAYGAGDDIAAGDKTEDVAFALSSTRYTRDNYVQTGWALTDGGDKAYDLGGSYTENADLVLYPVWTALDVQTDVTGAATWDWSNFGTAAIKLDGSTTPAKAEYFVLSNAIKYGLCGSIGGSFGNAQQLNVSLEYVVRDSKYCQGGYIKFNTTIPGTVSVKYTNTGNRDNEEDRRFLNINGTNYGGGTMSAKEGDAITTIVEVPAGEVTIKGTLKKDGSDQYLRIYKIIFTPVTSVSGTISAAGWNTFSSPYPLDMSSVTATSGASAYYASAADGSTVTLTKVSSGIVPAGEGIMIKGTTGESFTINTSSEAGTAISGNKLKGTPNGKTVAAADNAYVFAMQDANYGFFPMTSGNVPAGKAYLEYPVVEGAPSALRIVVEENNATNLNNIDASEEAVKFIQDGKLYIKRNGVVYDAMGHAIR